MARQWEPLFTEGGYVFWQDFNANSPTFNVTTGLPPGTNDGGYADLDYLRKIKGTDKLPPPFVVRYKRRTTEKEYHPNKPCQTYAEAVQSASDFNKYNQDKTWDAPEAHVDYEPK